MRFVTLGLEVAWIDPRGAVFIPRFRLLALRVPDIRVSLFPETESQHVAELVAHHEPRYLVLLADGQLPEISTDARVIHIGPEGLARWIFGQVQFSLDPISARPCIEGTDGTVIETEPGRIGLPRTIAWPDPEETSS